VHLLNSKCSTDFKEQIKLNQMKYQLVPPNNHRQNIAETAIKIFKAPSSASYAGVTNRSHYTYGIDFFLKQNIHSTCYDQTE
jgi:hypothetical protein